MPLWPLPGGVIEQPAIDQNFRSLAMEGGRIEGEMIAPSVATLPASGKAGQILFNEGDSKLYYFNGVAWVAV